MSVATQTIQRPSPDGSSPNARRRDRFAARHTLWDESSLRRVRKCGRTPVDGQGVGLRVTRGAPGGDVAGFSGLSTCGSVWACPVCAAKILAGRQEELEQALVEWTKRGGKVAMLTLTLRHHEHQSLETLWSAVTKCWAAVTSGRAWETAQARYGAPTERVVTRGARKGQTVTENRIGWVRAVEATHGENGWHPHVHVALLLPAGATAKDLDELGCELFQRWRDAAVKAGLGAPRARHGGLHVKLWDGRTGVLSEYFTKNEYSADAGKLANEVTRGGKDARGGNRTPFQILRDVVQLGTADDLDLWHEWESASKGRRQLTWSVGLRDLLLTEPELTDEELAEQEAGGVTELVVPTASWIVLVNTRTTVDLLEIAETGPGAAQEWLTARGLAWETPPAETEGAPRRRFG